MNIFTSLMTLPSRFKESCATLFYDVFSANGRLSSARIGTIVGLFSVIGLTAYDTYLNKRLDPILAGLLLTGGTVNYGISKQGEKNASISIKPTE